MTVDAKEHDPKATCSRTEDAKAQAPKATISTTTEAKGQDPKARDAKAAPPPLPPVVDENAPRLELTSSPFVSASSTTRATVTLTATNVGRRPMLVALHQRMLGFRIDGPDGVLRCS